jgi:membrane protein implicated in regulation of membrane protease activity
VKTDTSPTHQSKGRTAVRYFLLQLPGLAAFALSLALLRELAVISSSFLWTLLVVWVAKDIILFPFLWRFYDFNGHPDRFGMTGLRGIASTDLDPQGYVQVRGELWQAVVADGLKRVFKGEDVCVVSADGLKLTVRPCDQPFPES